MNFKFIFFLLAIFIDYFSNYYLINIPLKKILCAWNVKSQKLYTYTYKKVF